MANAKIVDIKGVQWELKDEVARNKIVELETKTTINEKILAQIGMSYISLITINDKKFFHLRFRGDISVSEIGQNILNIGIIEGLTGTISVIADLTKTNREGRYPTVVDITLEGEVKVYPMLPNQGSGSIDSCILYGDCFVVVS